jgi:hypothetical protein
VLDSAARRGLRFIGGTSFEATTRWGASGQGQRFAVSGFRRA